MAKLNNSDRELILKNLMNHKFKKDVATLVEKNAAFALKVFGDIFTEKDQKLMNSLPEGWLYISDEIKVKFSVNSYVNLRFDGVYNIWNITSRVERPEMPEINKRLPYAASRGGTLKVYESNEPLAEEYQALKDETEDFQTLVSKTYNSASAALQSVTTIGKLMKVWPEVKPFVPSYCFNENAIQLPTLRVDQLNNMLDLPI